MSLHWHQHLYYNNKLYKDGKEVNFNSICKKQVYSWAINDSRLKNETKPFFLFNGSHNIVFPNLSNVPDNAAFYFFEPLTYYTDNRKGYADHILRTDYADNVRSHELDSVDNFIKKHNITHHTVYLPDKHADQDLKKQYKLNFDYYDPYFDSEISRLNTLGRFLPHSYYTNKITKKLWCGNWRYDPVRHYIVSDLVDKGLHKDNLLSWFYYVPREDIESLMWFSGNIDINKLEKLNAIGPLRIDTNAKELVHYKNFYPEVQYKTKDCADYYQQCFCALVIETRVIQPWINLSEKTLYAIKNRRPFLLYAAPGSLQFLRDLGLKTFGDFWDESYDTITDSVKRISAINRIAEQLNNRSISELRKLYKDMEEILTHNIQHIKKIQF